MKTCRFFLIALLSFFYISLNAQFFAGGNLGFYSNEGYYYNGNQKKIENSNYGFSISPKMGKFLSEKSAVGLSLSFSISEANSFTDSIISKNVSFGLSPFLRYYLIKLNRFSVFGQGNIGFGVYKTKHKGLPSDYHQPNAIVFSLNFAPGMAYEISEKLALETKLDLIEFSYDYSIINSNSVKSKHSNFNFKAGLNNIAKLGDFSIGAIYKF